jgi:hypothetical protein
MDVSSSSKAKATARNVNARRRNNGNNYTNQTASNITTAVNNSGSSRKSSLHDRPTQASAEKRYAQLLHYTDAQQSATNSTSNTPARGYPSLSKHKKYIYTEHILHRHNAYAWLKLLAHSVG